MVVSLGCRQGFDKVMFPAKMKEKDTRVVLANNSPMIKLLQFSISLRESECNFVGLNLCTFLSMLEIGRASCRERV